MSHASKSGGKPLPMTVQNFPFLLDLLGRDCSPLQYLRELNQNAAEAISIANHLPNLHRFAGCGSDVLGFRERKQGFRTRCPRLVRACPKTRQLRTLSQT